MLTKAAFNDQKYSNTVICLLIVSKVVVKFKY